MTEHVAKRKVYYYQPKKTSSKGLSKVYFAGFWMRFLAYLVDLIVIALLCGIFVQPVYRVLGFEVAGGIFSIHWSIETIIFLAYFMLMTKFFQQTLGKMLFGLKVIRMDRKPLTWLNILFREGVMRLFLKMIWPLYIVTAFTPYKQGIADLIENTSVVHENLFKFETDHSH